ncbi:FecR family protein [Flavihumibacter sp. UBA7668]|uniref:FecR family protein n=1 Tax=Flavihumibacter sp. UBA7668 TaxID=1946542 RepID=UPI0025BB6988|nr:FecR family protein [Flavihumibacter sp. UBA7668]
MIHQPNYVQELIKKYFEGIASPSEIIQLRAAWKLYDEEELLKMMKEALMETDPQILGKNLRNWNPTIDDVFYKPTAWYEYSLRIAAVILLPLLLIAGLGYWYYNSQNREIACEGVDGNSILSTAQFYCIIEADYSKQLEVNRSFTGHSKTIGSIEWFQPEDGLLKSTYIGKPGSEEKRSLHSQIIRTTAGQQYQVVLPDGTRIRLNATSQIKISSAFKTDNRVDLEGEAFFDIPGSRTDSLIITTIHGTVKALNARFNLSTGKLRTIVALEKGALLMHGDTSSQLVNGENDVVMQAKSMVYFPNQNISQILTWQYEKRVYTGINMVHFVEEMGRWYGLTFENLNCVPNKSIKTNICYQASLEDMLGVLRKNGLNIRQVGTKISFCPPKGHRHTIASTNISIHLSHFTSHP